jgi:hypothetical protein
MLPRYGEWDAKWRDAGLRVVGVHTGEFPSEREARNVAAFVKRSGIRWPVVLDPDERAWDRFGVSAWPTLFVVDGTGVIRAVYVGDDHAAEIERELVKLLAR